MQNFIAQVVWNIDKAGFKVSSVDAPTIGLRPFLHNPFGILPGKRKTKPEWETLIHVCEVSTLTRFHLFPPTNSFNFGLLPIFFHRHFFFHTENLNRKTVECFRLFGEVKYAFYKVRTMILLSLFKMSLIYINKFSAISSSLQMTQPFWQKVKISLF